MKRWLLAGLGMLAVGCASGKPMLDPGVPPRNEPGALERRVVELEKDAVKTRLELERLRRRVAELEAAAKASPAAPPAVAVEAAPALAGAGIEADDLEERPSAGAVPPPTSSSSAASESAAYESALRLLRDGHIPEAEQALAAFLAAYPSSSLADNAWFWIGEARLSLGDTSRAAAAFRTAIERYPEGNKIPDALFKLGHCLSLQGDPAAAETVWREVTERFPGTVAAERARTRLGPGSGS